MRCHNLTQHRKLTQHQRMMRYHHPLRCHVLCGVTGYAVSCLLDTVEHLALHAVLYLLSAQHQLQHLVHRVLRIFLAREVRHDGVLGDLRADDKSALQLFVIYL